MARLSGFRSALTRCFSFDGPDEGVAMDEERKVPRPANDISRLAREFRGLQQLGHCDIIALLRP